MPLVDTRFASFGVHLTLRTTGDLLPQALQSLPPGWRLSSRPTPQRLYTLTDQQDGQYALWAGVEEVTRTPDVARILKAFESDSRLFIAEFAPRYVFVHAGVVGWRGQAILMPGRSYSGKTTLVAALVRAGATYFSDEYAVLDSHGRVHPYPKPLAIRDPHSGEQVDHSVDSLGGQTARQPLVVGLVLVSEYQPRAAWRPRTLTPGEGLLALADNAVAIRRAPRRVLRILSRVSATALTIQGKRSNVEAIISYLEAPRF